MSLPNSPGFANSPDTSFPHQRSNKQKLRSVRLELPSTRDFTRFSPLQTQQTAKNGSFGSVPITLPHTHQKQRTPSVTTNFGNVTLISPNVFYQFPPNVTASFIYEVVIPDNALTFVAQPGVDLISPRFLIYTACSTAISTQPVKFVLNGRKVEHWMSDPMPLDVTDFLVPFGQQNWLIVETGTLAVPFAVIGVWCSLFTFQDIYQTIASRERFPFTEIGAICPLTGCPIEIPAKGVNCNHPQCFDLYSYIINRQAVGIWLCPICNQLCALADLRIGETSTEIPVFEKPPQQEPGGWGTSGNDPNDSWTIPSQDESQQNSFDGYSSFWNQDII